MTGLLWRAFNVNDIRKMLSGFFKIPLAQKRENKNEMFSATVQTCVDACRGRENWSEKENYPHMLKYFYV